MKLRNRFLIRCLAQVIAWTCRALFQTVRVKVIEEIPQTSPYAPSDERFIYCVWHDGLMGAIFGGRTLSCAALTSRHADGEYVADAMRAVGIHPIRGSSNHGGATAIRQMIAAAEKHHVVITTDGPRGPRRQVKAGLVFLASHSGRRIIPVGVAGRNAWKPQGKWTDLIIPKPFSTCIICGGEPISIPPNLTREQLAPYVQLVQQRMDEMQAKADSLATGEQREQAEHTLAA